MPHKRKPPIYAASGSADWRACCVSYTVASPGETGPLSMRGTSSHARWERMMLPDCSRHPHFNLREMTRSDRRTGRLSGQHAAAT